MRFKTVSILVIVLLLWIGTTYGDILKGGARTEPRLGKSLVYTAKKFGIPILKATLRIQNGATEQGKPLYDVEASVDSLGYLGLLFRMKNRFTTTVDGESLIPLRYVKEVDQEGWLIGKKHYRQTLTFDVTRSNVVEERTGMSEMKETPLPPNTYDPLSMFARYYLRDSLPLNRNIEMSLYDGVKLRHMVFHSKKGKVQSEMYGEVDAICIESTTSFASFGDKEGKIRICYTADGKKTPISMELDLPVGAVRFDLEEIREN